MKKMNKKGFTIVELVIVIAVIAILAAVLIPTFTGVVDKANDSKAMQEAKNEYTNYIMFDETAPSKNYFIIVDNKYAFVVDNGEFKTTAYTLDKSGKVTVKYGETSYTLTVKDKQINIDGYTMENTTSNNGGKWVVNYKEGDTVKITATQYQEYETEYKTNTRINIFEIAFVA